jgi:hypothetical protein
MEGLQNSLRALRSQQEARQVQLELLDSLLSNDPNVALKPFAGFVAVEYVRECLGLKDADWVTVDGMPRKQLRDIFHVLKAFGFVNNMEFRALWQQGNRSNEEHQVWLALMGKDPVVYTASREIPLMKKRVCLSLRIEVPKHVLMPHLGSISEEASSPQFDSVNPNDPKNMDNKDLDAMLAALQAEKAAREAMPSRPVENDV